MRFIPDFRSLSAQMILSFIAVEVFTTIIASILSICLIRQPLNYQAWAHIERGQYATQALYSARQSEVVDFVISIAQRPDPQKNPVSEDLGKVTGADRVIPTNQNLANLEADMQVLAEQIASKPLDALRQDMEMLVRSYNL